MAHTVFVDGSTVTANRIVAAWLNDADTVTYVRFGDGTSYTGNLTVPGTTSLTGTLTAAAINAGAISGTTGAFNNTLTLSNADQRVVTGTTTGRGLISNSTTSTYISIYGATHATLADVFAVNTPTTSIVLNSTGLAVNGTLSVSGTSTMAAVNASGNINVSSSNIVLTAATGAINAVGALTLAPASANPLLTLTDATKGSGYIQGGVNTGGTGAGDYWIFNVPTSRGLSWAVNNSTVLNAVAAGVTIPGTLGVTVAINGNTFIGNNVTTNHALEVGSTNGTSATLTLSGSQSITFKTYSGGWNTVATLDSSGNLLVGTTSQPVGTSRAVFSTTGNTQAAIFINDTFNYSSTINWNKATANNNYFVEFATEGTYTARGSITYNRAGGLTVYSTTSDYRLKEHIIDLPNALETVSRLKPRQFDWKETGNTTTGFIAHELAEVCPHAVTGEKDAVEMRQYEISPAILATQDEEGNELTAAVEAVMGEREVPRYQGIDASFLVATLTAAIQELAADFQAYKSSHP